MGHGQYLIYRSSKHYCFSGFGKPCSYSLYVPLYSDGFPAMDGMFPDTFKCSTIKRNSWTFINFFHGTVATTSTTTTITHHCRHHHYHNHHNWPKQHFRIFHFSLWGKSRTKASFWHLPRSIFEGSLARKFHFHIFRFQFQQCLALACCSSWTSNVHQEKHFFSEQWASVWPIGIMRFLVSLSFGLSFGTPGWITRICKTMILGNPSFENS